MSKLSAWRRHRGLQMRGSLKRVVYRALDVALAGSALALTFPLLASISLLIFLDDHGPILAPQRVDRIDGRQFMLWRFRTGLKNAGARAEQYLSAHPNEALSYPVRKGRRHAPRLSNVGAVLYRTGLNDIPMLLNVLSGDIRVFGRYTWREFIAWLNFGEVI
jgi:lipopolysaccharide/colanic/teichoic acid biosynthesis glycosyltransferase